MPIWTLSFRFYSRQQNEQIGRLERLMLNSVPVQYLTICIFASWRSLVARNAPHQAHASFRRTICSWPRLRSPRYQSNLRPMTALRSFGHDNRPCTRFGGVEDIQVRYPGKQSRVRKAGSGRTDMGSCRATIIMIENLAIVLHKEPFGERG